MHYPIVFHYSMNISPLLAKYHQPHHRPQSTAGLVASLWGGGQGIRQVGAEGRHQGQWRWRKFPPKKQRNTSENAETLWKSLENHGNILKQLLKTYGNIYGTTWKKTGKKVPASPIWIDTDSQWIAKHGISWNFGIRPTSRGFLDWEWPRTCWKLRADQLGPTLWVLRTARFCGKLFTIDMGLSENTVSINSEIIINPIINPLPA